jgi:thiopurine S-methyltransferase
MWRKDQTAFHQQVVNPLLIRFWTSLELKKPSRIFVPLCGKSLDLIWVMQQGNEVIGVELSPVAVKAFFNENGLAPHKQKQGKMTVWQDGRMKILCGDYFSLDRDDLGEIDVVYDRAALTALPEDSRKKYVAHLRAIVPLRCRIFLLTVEDAVPEWHASMLQDSRYEVDKEVKSLYEPYFAIDIAHAESAWEADMSGTNESASAVVHKVYRLVPRI